MKNKRIIYIDVLNILAIIAVVALHCNGIVHTYSKERAWATSLIVETVFYWAVPVFLMITGTTLMNYREKYDTKTFFKKRFKKVVIPFLFWIILMTVWKCSIGKLRIEGNYVKNFLNIVLQNKEESTYYFLFVIMGIYLTLPLLSLVAKKEYKKTLWYVVVVFFITKSFLPVASQIIGISYNNDLSIQIGNYIVFVILGYLLSTTEINKKKRIIIYVLGILSVILRYSLTYYWSTQEGKIIKTLFGYSQFHSILLAVAVFIFINNINFKFISNNEKMVNIISKIASCSFGIYLLHQIVMYYEITLLNVDIHSWSWRTVGIVTTYLISLAIVYILKKIPILKKVVP